MPSRTSYFNAALFRKNLTRFWPLWGLASFAGALLPLFMLFSILRMEEGLAVDPLDFTYVYYAAVSVLPIFSLLYAALVSMAVWSYLYNARSVGLMHTLPIRREGVFVTNLLSGLAMMLAPYVVTGGLSVLISIACGAFDPAGVGVAVLAVLGESFFYFSTATFAAFLTGNVFALPALYFLLHFLAPVLDLLLSTLASGFLLGLDGRYSGAVDFLSPTVFFCRKVGVTAEYREVWVPDAYMTAGGYNSSVMESVSLVNGWLIGVYALAGVLFLAAAWALYRARRSESAGEVAAAPWLRPVYRYGAAALCAAGGGLLLYILFWSSFQEGRFFDVLPMLICMAVCGTIGYYAASMLLAKSVRVFHKSLPGLGAVVLGCCILCAVMRLDLLGVARRVPAADRLESLTVNVAGNRYTLHPGEDDGPLIEELRRIHQAIVDDSDYIVDSQSDLSAAHAAMEEGAGSSTAAADGAGAEDTAGVQWEYIRFTYRLKNGLEVSRAYSVPMSRSRIAQEGTYDFLMDRAVNGGEMKSRRLHLNDPDYVPSGGSVYPSRQEMGYDLNSREAARVQAAVGRDLASGAWGSYDWFSSESGRYAIDLELSFTYSYSEEGHTYNSTDWITIVLRPGMDETVRCLKDLGVITDEDLLTREELDAYRSRQSEYEEPYEKPSPGTSIPADAAVYPEDAVVYPEDALVSTEEAGG